MIPKGQNAFTWQPQPQFSASERAYEARKGVAGGKKRALQQKGIAVHGLKSDPSRAPAKYRGDV